MQQSDSSSTRKTVLGSRKRLGSRGVASVEMALMAPVLILLLLGVIDISRAAVVAIRVVSAASSAAQYGAQGPAAAVDHAAIQLVAQQDSSMPSLTTSSVSMCKCSNGDASTCQVTDCSTSRLVEYVQVTATAPWEPLFAYPGIPTTINLSSTSTVQVIE